MSRRVLIIFIDGLRFDHASTRLSVLRKARISPVVPGLGFSNNLYPEMFSGMDPDTLGFFNEWSPASAIKPVGRLHPLRILDLLRRFPYLNAGIRILVLRKLFGLKTANIPFKYWKFFEAAGPHNVRSLGPGSVLSDHGFQIQDSAEIPLKRSRRNHRDIAILERVAQMALEDRNLFISLTETDSIAHADGLDSPPYQAHLRYLDEQLTTVITRYRTANPDGSVYMLSDHGMAPVLRQVYVDLEGELGAMEPGRYLFFLDSTFLRVWLDDEALDARVREYLVSLQAGVILSDEERTTYGVSNRDFGDIIFRADEGVLFTPSFFGFRPVQAMHGYDSRLPSQTAFFAEVHGTGAGNALPTRSKEVFEFLSRELSGGRAAGRATVTPIESP